MWYAALKKQIYEKSKSKRYEMKEYKKCIKCGAVFNKSCLCKGIKKENKEVINKDGSRRDSKTIKRKIS